MNKKVMFFLEKQVNLIMVDKIFIYLFYFIFVTFNTYSEVLYEKNNIIITDIDIKTYKELYENNYGLNINDASALKDLVLIENVINNLENNNSEFMDRLDEQIQMQFGNMNLNNKSVKNFIRFLKIRDEFTVNYFQNNLNIEEVQNLFNSLVSLKLPISNNNCLIIKEILDLKNNIEFIKSYIDSLKNSTDKILITINDKEYQVCIDNVISKNLENIIIEYIQNQTNDDFEAFVYERAKS